MSITPLDKLLSLLHGGKRIGPSAHVALCPAQDDRHPSLSIKETADGVLLLRCWAGCSVDQIVGAVGLDLRDLFPPRDATLGAGRPPQRRPWMATELLHLSALESTVVVVITADVVAGRVADLSRLYEACRRLMLMVEATNATR